jgi:hypothetical protein
LLTALLQHFASLIPANADRLDRADAQAFGAAGAQGRVDFGLAVDELDRFERTSLHAEGVAGASVFVDHGRDR